MFKHRIFNGTRLQEEGQTPLKIIFFLMIIIVSLIFVKIILSSVRIHHLEQKCAKSGGTVQVHAYYNGRIVVDCDIDGYDI